MIFQIPGHAFIGPQNFEQILTDPLAGSSLVLTFVLASVGVILECLFGLGLAFDGGCLPGRGIVHVNTHCTAVDQPSDCGAVAGNVLAATRRWQ
jgi:hypothetical protein